MCTKMVSKTFVFQIIYLSAYLCICSSHKDTSSFGDDSKALLEERNRERRAAPDISIGNNTCIPIIYNQETYYTVETKSNLVDQYWVEIPDNERQTIKPNTKTNHQKLSFGFPLFGHTVHTIFPTVNGFISTRGSSPEAYVAPFFTDRNISYPIISHNTERFVVEWNGKSESKCVRDEKYSGTSPPTSPNGSNILDAAVSANEKLQIQTIGYRNGTIMFLYKRLSDVYRNTNVTIGVDNNVWVLMEGVTAIVAYKEIDVDLDTIAEGTVLIFTPVGECDLTRNARKCDTLMATFYCEVCHVIKHCDWEVHRHVSHWMDTSCTIQVPSFCKQSKPSSMISTIFIVVVSGIGLIILSIVAVWFYYAYTRPTTPSGRWLIEHRPSQWKNFFIRRKEESDREGNNPSLTMEEDK